MRRLMEEHPLRNLTVRQRTRAHNKLTTESSKLRAQCHGTYIRQFQEGDQGSFAGGENLNVV